MKKVFLVVICAVCMLLSGCNTEKPTIEEYTNKDIQRVNIYHEEDGSYRSVWIYLDECKRTVTIYSDTKQVVEDEYAYGDELEEFIRENIFSKNTSVGGGAAGNDNDEQKVLWQLKVVFSDGESESWYDFDEYPEYWDDLMLLIEK